MLRIFGISGAICLAAIGASAAAAQPPAVESEQVVCPRDALTIYYARGESVASEQAQVLISRIGVEAQQCRPDAIDLITAIDTSREGDGALTVAMARLHGVAAALVADGFPAERIRIAAQSDPQSSPLAEITVLFRKSEAAADTAAAPVRKPNPLAARDAI